MTFRDIIAYILRSIKKDLLTLINNTTLYNYLGLIPVVKYLR